METPDQEILYAIREHISEHQLSMNATGLDLGTGAALVVASREQWQQDPDQVVTLSAGQLAQAIATAKHQGMQEVYELAQNALTEDAGPRQT
ncbi:hypothetical protein [Cryptosporangium phraense]|uniref:Uncharacterized protein n=1 Tax=Cryptosporangium phraense TaxID=2593070 RepID=A0A545AZW6_9ACTN|nr:hypothetical protein [Cryptosporangium phraense]TQS46848.1 hypothetical protein FL583_00795 [Cryptosporangium phraense]